MKAKEEKKLARHWVLVYGKDCDGHNSGKVYPFLQKEEAEEFANTCNDGSDGLVYNVTDDWQDVVSYCKCFDKNLKNYINL